MTKQKPKYKYLKVLQGYYSSSYGWEDLVEAEKLFLEKGSNNG